VASVVGRRTDKSLILNLRFLGRLVAMSMIIFLAAETFANAADAGPTRRVLMISTGGRFGPGFTLIEQSALDRLKQLSAQPIDFYFESLDIVRFPSESYHRLFRGYLYEKYNEYPPDLVILLYVGKLTIAQNLLGQLFPSIPVVVAGLTEEDVPLDQLGKRISGLAQRADVRGTIALLLRLQPETSRIVVVGGTADVDRDVISRTREAAQTFNGQVKFEFWTNRSLPELREAVKTLSAQTVVLFTRMFRDGAGQAVMSVQAAQMIAESANVPLYVMTDAMLGTGAVGGSVADIGALGKQVGELAARIFDGPPSTSFPFEVRTTGVPTFDWRALKRWGISESRLPPGSAVRFRPPSMWEQYGWYIIGALAIIAVEAVLIAGLLLQRSRRRRAESELRESQEFMELSTSAGELGLWMRDLTGGDLWTNPRLRSLFGFGQSDVLRIDDVFARIHPDDRSQVVSVLQHAQEDGLPFETEFRVLNNGTERWIAAKGRSVGNAPGGATRRMGVLTEITARKKAELETQRHRDELAHVSRVSMMGQLASALAHELNQPLGAILRNAEAAELFIRASPPDLQEVCAILADIRKDDQRAGDVIDRMRALLKRREFQWSDLDLNALVEDVAGLLRTDAEARRVKVSLELALPAPPVRGDRVQLQQVMLNLILNAMDAMNGCDAGKRSVTVRVRRVAEWAEVAVSDTASGIPEENLKRLFEPFFTTKPTGLGLGLAISHTIIEAHGGRLWAENNPEAGATFRYTLPVVGSVEGRGSSLPDT
jgi:PAS domain S-box-containing protein